jgi:hypothetical protein
MSTQARYVPTGELQGDTTPITDKGAAREGHYDKSLGEASRSDLLMGGGYHGRKSITGSTQSDAKGFA